MYPVVCKGSIQLGSRYRPSPHEASTSMLPSERPGTHVKPACAFCPLLTGEVARYDCPSPRRRSPAHKVVTRGARECDRPRLLPVLLDHRAWYAFPNPKMCRFRLSWDCMSSCKYGGTVPLAEKPGGSEFPLVLGETSGHWLLLGSVLPGPCRGGQQASTCSDQ